MAQNQPNRPAQQPRAGQAQPGQAITTEMPDDVARPGPQHGRAGQQRTTSSGRSGVWVALAADLVEGFLSNLRDVFQLSDDDMQAVIAQLGYGGGSGEQPGT